MPIAERMTLADGKPLPRKLYAAMAQQDCGQCGYLCETYSKAIAEGKETKLNLCVPGGKETSRMLKRLLEETPAPAAGIAVAEVAPAPAPRRRSPRQGPASARGSNLPRRHPAQRQGLGEGYTPCRIRHLASGLAYAMRRRQLRPVPEERSGARRGDPLGPARAP